MQRTIFWQKDLACVDENSSGKRKAALTCSQKKSRYKIDVQKETGVFFCGYSSWKKEKPPTQYEDGKSESLFFI